MEMYNDRNQNHINTTTNPAQATRTTYEDNQREASTILQTRPQHTQITHTSGLRAGDNVNEKIKEKIWDHKYLDFYTLLYPDTDSNYTFSINNQTNFPAIELQPKKKRALNEREWGRAWDDYIAIYTRRYPEQLWDLLTYGKFIKNMMDMGHNWSYYDSNFRKDREFSLCNWTTIRIDLQIQASKSYYRHHILPTKNSNSHIPRGCLLYTSPSPRDKRQSRMPSSA